MVLVMSHLIKIRQKNFKFKFGDRYCSQYSVMFFLFVDWVFIKRMYQNNPILDMLHMLDDLGADYQAGDSRSIIH